jgi:hypothetical protein
LKKFLLIFSILLISSACREEIIEPDNFVGKINEPVQVKERNSYTCLLNAKNLSMDLSVLTYFSAARTRFNIRLIDYESGYMSISVQDLSNLERFRYYAAEDVSYHTELLEGYVPSTIKITTDNFTGKIIIEFRKTL